MIFVIAGATATGKTKIAQKLALEFNGYLLNGDSRQVYKELNIGTAKPTPEEIAGSKIEHRLFGHVNIDEVYNLYRYQKEAMEIIQEKEKKGTNTFLVGGTGLYIDSVVFNYQLEEKKSHCREEFSKLKIKQLQEKVGEELKKLNESDRKNPRRLIRFLEREGKSLKKGEPLKHMYFVLEKDFAEIEKNIEERIQTMFQDGLVEENEELFKSGKHEKINTIGYVEFREFFEKRISLQEVKKSIFLNTRKYAKRQITWFKRNENAIFFKNYEQIHSIILEGIE